MVNFIQCPKLPIHLNISLLLKTIEKVCFLGKILETLDYFQFVPISINGLWWLTQHFIMTYTM